MRRLALGLFVALVIGFLLLPLVVVIATSFGNSDLMTFPPTSFTLKWYGDIPHEFYGAAETSLIVGGCSTFLAVLVGTPAALALVRGRFVGAGLINALFVSPLVVPTLVIGVAGFQFLMLVWRISGIDLQDTYLGVILGHTSFTTAFVIRSVIAAQANFDRALEEASINLGATPLQTFFRVTMPLIRPGILSGAAFAFLMSFDELPIALFLGGARVTTLPVKIFTTLEDSLDTWIMALAALIIFVSLALILIVQRAVGLHRLLAAK
jgi:putative spermidine/putrescine transport system permease protein